MFERLGNESNLDVIRKSSLVDAFMTSYLRSKTKDAAQALWTNGVVRYLASDTAGNISLADEGSIDTIFNEMRSEGLVFERESIKSINTVLEFGPWLGMILPCIVHVLSICKSNFVFDCIDEAAVEGVILGMSRAVASSQDNVVFLTVGTIMHKLIKK